MNTDFHSQFPPCKGRTHEVTGAGAGVFAFALAGQLQGAVLWIREAWQPEQLNPAGFGEYLDPARILLAQGKDQTEVLAVAEEALRSGAVKLVVIELGKPLGLTAGRRLQLAAETGKSTGLCILPEGMGSNAAQTRWRCTPIFNPNTEATDSTLQRWELIKNKSGTLGKWDIRWNGETRRVIVVSEAGK